MDDLPERQQLMRALSSLALALLLIGCRTSSPSSPSSVLSVEVRTATNEEALLSSVTNPPVFAWDGSASKVEVQHTATGRVVWWIEQYGNPRGPAYLASPLVYGAYARGPGWSPPPDAAEPMASDAEPLVRGTRYTVTVYHTAELLATTTFTY